jgi:virginiamycin B lyase
MQSKPIHQWTMRILSVVTGIAIGAPSALAVTVKVTDANGKSLQTVMVTQTTANVAPLDTSDGGFQKPNMPVYRHPEFTGFTDAKGVVTYPDDDGLHLYRFRKTGFKDVFVDAKNGQKSVTVKMEAETDPVALANAKPANVWLGAIDIGGTSLDKIAFKMQCGFCHQQGSMFTRVERSPEDWDKVIKRMIRYGSRLPSSLQKSLPQKLSDGYRLLRDNPKLLGESTPLDSSLSGVKVTEWPIGSAMSQTHDMLIGLNKLVYVADNIQDRLYEIDPVKSRVAVYKIPHKEGDKNGGLISGRLKEFPSHDSTSNAHSLAQSEKDGHIFITPSAQRRLIEFDPATKAFTIHDYDDGFYPHTVRVDQKDNVWFTLALSNQVAKFDRTTKQFKMYDLPARSFKEKLITQNIGALFKVMSWGIPLSNWLKIDFESMGTPLVYGIDVTPDGKVWFARLHTREIGVIDPATDQVTLIPTPFHGPRRLRTDAEGNLWIVSFGESKIAKYNPKTSQFLLYDLPVSPKGSETPYSLNVDKKRNVVWVNGNQSDALYGFDVKTEKWKIIPYPRRVTFTRDVEIDEDGTMYTSNSNFPSWHVEGAQPTLIRVQGAAPAQK